MYEVHVKGH